jgi:cell division inhibitor SulA
MKLNKMKEFLTSEQISSHLKKRKAVDALSEGNDDVVFSGVADVAEAVAKRVKAAEDAGEVIEIL